MKYLTISSILLLALIHGYLVEAEGQYYDSRGVWGIAVDAIVQNTKVQASAAAGIQEILRGDQIIIQN